MLNYVGNDSVLAVQTPLVLKVLAGHNGTTGAAITNSSASTSGTYAAVTAAGASVSGSAGSVAATGTTTVQVGFSDYNAVGTRTSTALTVTNSANANDSGAKTVTWGAGSGVYASAVLSQAQSVASGTTTFTMGNSGTGSLVANATVSNVSLSNAQTGFATAMSGSTSIATGSSAAVATFDSNGKLNGTYKGTLNYSAQNDASIAGAAANDLTSGSAGSRALSVNVSLKTGSGTAQILAGGSYKDYGIDTGAGLSGSTGHTTTATILGGTNTTVAAVNLTMTLSNAALIKSSKYLSSNAVDISGINGTMFVLQMNYDPNSNVGSDPYYIGWYDATLGWVNAIAGNSGTHTGIDFLGNNAIVGAYNASTDYQLGLYGFDSRRIRRGRWWITTANSP